MIVLCCAVCAVFMVVLSTRSVDFLEVFLKETETIYNRKNTTNRQILKNAPNPKLFFIESRTIVTMKTSLPAGFPAAVKKSTAIQSSDQQHSRNFLRLRTVVLFFDELVGWDGWVYNSAGSPVRVL